MAATRVTVRKRRCVRLHAQELISFVVGRTVSVTKPPFPGGFRHQILPLENQR